MPGERCIRGHGPGSGEQWRAGLWMRLLAAAALIKLGAALAAAAAGGAAALSFEGVRALVYIVVFGLVGLALLVSGHGDRRAVVLGLFFLVSAMPWADWWLDLLRLRRPELQGAAILLLQAQIVALAPLLFWQFVLDFPRRPGVRHGVATHLAVAAAALVGGVLFGINLAVLLPNAGTWLSHLPSLQRSPQGYTFWAIILLTLLPALGYSAGQIRHAQPAERRRVRLMLVGMLIGLTPEIVLTIAAAVWRPLAAYALSPDGRLVITVTVTLPLLSIPFTTAYAVLVHRALDVRLYVRKAVQYALARQTVGVTAALPFLALLTLVYAQREQSVAALWTGSSGLLALTAAGLGFVLVRSRGHILTGLDRRFFREQYDARQTLTGLLEEVRRVATLPELADALKRETDRALHLRTVRTLLLDPAAGLLTERSSGGGALAVHARLARRLEESAAPLDVDWQWPAAWLAALPEAERRWLRATGAQLLVPIPAADGSLLGLLALGEKRSELPFSREDRMLLTTIAGAVAFAIEHRLRFVHVPGSERSAAAGAEAGAARECVGCGAVSAPDARRCEQCGDGTRPASVPRVLAGKFRLLRRVGAGGMGVVYQAVDLALDRPVAVKSLPRLSADEARRLRAEARAMAAVSHPNLALLLGAESWNGIPVLILEFLAGGTLAERLARGPLDAESALGLGHALARALTHLHEASIVHRDIKPSNIGYAADGTPKLLDFGLARMLTAAQPAHPAGAELPEIVRDAQPGAGQTASALAGTPLYLAPEAVAGERPGAASDLWALCLVLYEAVAGRHPFAAASLHETLSRVRRAEIPDLRVLAPQAPAPLAEFFHGALAVDRRRRPTSARELGERLEQLRGAPVART